MKTYSKNELHFRSFTVRKITLSLVATLLAVLVGMVFRSVFSDYAAGVIMGGASAFVVYVVGKPDFRDFKIGSYAQVVAIVPVFGYFAGNGTTYHVIFTTQVFTGGSPVMLPVPEDFVDRIGSENELIRFVDYPEQMTVADLENHVMPVVLKDYLPLNFPRLRHFLSCWKTPPVPTERM